MSATNFVGKPIKSMRDLFENLREVGELFRQRWTRRRPKVLFDGRLWYRGVSSAVYDLKAKVFRRISLGEEDPNLTFRRADEIAMAAEFRMHAHTRHPACPREDDVAQWLCLMQHYGLPTRLLDWTESILAAAFFAVYHWQERVRRERICAENVEKAGPAVIWVLCPRLLNLELAGTAKILTLEAEDDRLRNLIRFALGLRDARKPGEVTMAVVPPEMDLRMLLQQGTFTIHGTHQALDETEGWRRYGACLQIPFQRCRRLLDELASVGVRQSTIYPDLGSLTHDIEQKYVRGRRRQSIYASVQQELQRDDPQ